MSADYLTKGVQPPHVIGHLRSQRLGSRRGPVVEPLLLPTPPLPPRPLRGYFLLRFSIAMGRYVSAPYALRWPPARKGNDDLRDDKAPFDAHSVAFGGLLCEKSGRCDEGSCPFVQGGSFQTHRAARRDTIDL